MYKLILVLLAAIILAACGGTPATPTTPPQPSATTTAAALPTDTEGPTDTPTDTPAPSATATQTPEPTATVTPTLIPTPDLPLGPGGSLPQPLLTISLDSAAAISELARYGTARIYGAIFSPDRSTILSLTGEGIKAYQANTMERLAWFGDLDPLMSSWGIPMWGVTSSTNGQRFSMLTSKAQAQVYDLQGGLVYSATLPSIFWGPWATLSTDGLYLAIPQIGEDEYAMRWQVVDIADGSVLADGIGLNARFSPNGTYLVGNASDTLYIYRTSDWQEQTQIGLRAGGETALDWSFSPDERYLAVVMSSGVTVWEVETRQRVRQFNPVTGGEAEISQAFFSEDSSQMAVVEYIERISSNLLIWNITDGSIVSNQTTEESGIYDYDVVLLDLDDLHGYTVPRESDGSGYQSPQWTERQKAFDLIDASLNVVDAGWDFEVDQPIYTACAFVFSPASEPLCQEASGALGVTTDGLGHFYSLWRGEGDDVALYSGLEQTGAALLTFSTDGYRIDLLGVSPNQSLLVYNLGSTLQVRALSGGRLMLNEASNSFGRVSFSSDSSRMVASEALVYDAVQNAVLFRLPGQNQMAGRSAVLSSDGERLAYRFERWDALRWYGIQVWDPLHQRQLAEWEGSVEELGSPIAFSPDGRLLAAVDETGTVFLLDAESGEVLHQWKAHADTVLNLAFSPDGTLLATSGTDGFLRLWGVYP